LRSRSNFFARGVLGAGMGEAGVEADAGDEKPDAVRAEHAQQIGPRRFEHRLLQASPVGEFAPRQAGGDDDRGARAAPAECVDESGNRLRRRQITARSGAAGRSATSA
jgi:hypothetical protein